MGIKMKEAKYKGNIVTLSQYEDKMKGCIVCKYCGVPISHSAGYVKQIGEKDVNVSPYYRLTNGHTNPHNEEICEYVTENVIKDIFAKSGNNNDLMSFDEGKYIVRLHVLVDTMEVEYVSKDTGEEKKVNRSTLNYIKTGDKTAYITTLRRIMKLRYEIEEKAELKKYLTLKFYNNRTKKYDEISWDDFFIEYDDKCYVHAYKHILDKVFHPICFCGVIKSVSKPTEKFSKYKISIYSVKVDEGKYVLLSILFDKLELFEKLKDWENKQIVVYGSNAYARQPFRKKIEKDDGTESEIEFDNINVEIFDVNQILCLDY